MGKKNIIVLSATIMLCGIVAPKIHAQNYSPQGRYLGPGVNYPSLPPVNGNGPIDPQPHIPTSAPGYYDSLSAWMRFSRDHNDDREIIACVEKVIGRRIGVVPNGVPPPDDPKMSSIAQSCATEYAAKIQEIQRQRQANQQPAQSVDYIPACQKWINGFEKFQGYTLSFEKYDWGRTYHRDNPYKLVNNYTTFELNGTGKPLAVICYTLADQHGLSFAEVVEPATDKVIWCLMPGRATEGECPITGGRPLRLSDAGGQQARDTAQARCLLSAIAKTTQIAHMYQRTEPGAARNLMGNDMMGITDKANEICKNDPFYLFQ